MTAGTSPIAGGYAKPGYERVQEAFAAVIAGHPGGASAALYVDGEEVLSLWGGRSITTGREFTPESLVMTASCTKGVTSICAMILAERGDLDLDAPVARYWPEFAAGGKGRIPVRWLLTHQAGLPVFDPAARFTADDLLDWDKAVSSLAAQEPLWEPGTQTGYHAVTFGYLVGEVIRRVSGRTTGQFLAEHAAGPLGADFWIGLPAEYEPRVLPNVVPPGAPAAPPDLREVFQRSGVDAGRPLARAMLAPSRGDQGPGDPVWNTRPFHAAEIPAVNGIGTARGLARLFAACVGKVGGVRLLSPEIVDAARTPQTDSVPAAPEFLAIAARPPRFGLGFQLPGPPVVTMLGDGSFGTTGAGGRLAFAHPERRAAFAFTCDTMLWNGLTEPDPRWPPLLTQISEALGRLPEDPQPGSCCAGGAGRSG
jgi:CubicO group peptidase (beta-lactamase class C family)